jgi:hypothetical protein
VQSNLLAHCLCSIILSQESMKLKPAVTLLTAPGKVELWTRGERFAVYLPDAPTPGFQSLWVMGSRSLTQTAENGLALWLRHGSVNGVAFGTEDADGRFVTEDFTARRGSLTIGFQHILRWEALDGKPLLTETRTVRALPAPSEGSILDIQLELTANRDSDLLFEPSLDSFLTLQLAPALTSQGSGQMRNSLGDYGAEHIHGRSARWAGAVGVVERETVGLVFLEHSGNLWFPAPWIATNSGSVSPSGFGWRTHKLPAGHTLTLRYRLQTHVGYVDQGWGDARLLDFIRDTH